MESTDAETQDESSKPRFFGVGGSIDWKAASKEVALCVELPFWLMTPAAHLTVAYGGCEIPVIIDNDGVEIQRGNQFSRTGRNTAFIGNTSAAQNSSVPVSRIPDGGSFRGTRTLLYLPVHANMSALEGLFGPDTPHFQDGYRYFASLALGHLPVLNELINAYRRASVDPFVTELTSWDVPVWFVSDAPRCQPICLYSHLVADWFPGIRDGTESRPYFAADTDALNQNLASKAIPGEIEILDAWSLFHRGRYADSIRSFVTSIEVLVESEIRRLLTEAGVKSSDIDARLEATRNSFDKRLTDYCELSMRRIPGPILHEVPYINGIRLRNELDRTRRLRHKIVHHGHRLTHSFSKPMLQSAETTSWLFDWLATGADFEQRRRKNSTYFSMLRTSSTPFETSLKDGKIVVESLFPDDISQMTFVRPDHLAQSDDAFLATISAKETRGKDLEFFVKLAFFELGMGEIEDSPFPVGDLPIPERFRLQVDSKAVLIFLIDLVDDLSVESVLFACRSLARSRYCGVGCDRGLLVFNPHQGRVWNQRTTSQDPASGNIAREHGISLIATADLARLTMGATNHGWRREQIVRDLLVGGAIDASPPSGRLLGHVYHYWQGPQVVGIEPAQPSSIRDGDIVAFSLREGFHQMEVDSPQVDSSGRVTFKTGFNRSDVRIGGKVFILDRNLSFDSPPTTNVAPEFSSGSAVASRIIHPTNDR